MQFRLDLCQACAAKLRRILKEQGEKEMGRRLGGALCGPCKRKIPGHQPGRELVTVFKGRPS